jgi:hypothetical protein
MIELVVFIALIGIGIVVKQQSAVHQQVQHADSTRRVPRADRPIAQDPYAHRQMNHVKAVERRRADAHVPKAISDLNRDDAQWSDLSGKPIVFKHNNMTPFFRGSVKQNTKEDAFQAKFEAFTGSDRDTYIPRKHEASPFFQPRDSKNADMTGMPGNTAAFQERAGSLASTIHNGFVPFEQQRVGPGIMGKSAEGFQQLDVDQLRPPDVDALRSKANPKATWKGVTLMGQKGTAGHARDKIGKVRKNRFETFIEQSFGNLFKTTGAFIKSMQVPVFAEKSTRLLDDKVIRTGAYVGAARSAIEAESMRPQFRAPSDARQVPALDNARAQATNRGQGSREDHGRASIQVYDNERRVVSCKSVYQGGLTSMVKAFVAPITDAIKFTPQMAASVHHPRPFGEVDVQAPSKMRVHDPADVARTTIRQDTSQETSSKNAAPQHTFKLTIYDPSDITRTTIRQTTMAEVSPANISAPYKLTIHDPNDVTRKTVRETTLSSAEASNLASGTHKPYVHDPGAKAKPTVRESTDAPTDAANLVSGTRKTYTYDPESWKTKTTVRDTTLQDVSDAGSLAALPKNRTYDPDAWQPRPTVREGTDVDASDTGALRSGGHKGPAYDPADGPRATIREGTAVDQSDSGAFKAVGAKGVAYDPEDGARKTIREGTAVDQSDTGAFKAVGAKGVAYDPEDGARKTIREGMVADQSDTGALRTTSAQGVAYDPEAWRTRPTIREGTDGDKSGMGALSSGSVRGVAYEPSEWKSRRTVRELTDADRSDAGALSAVGGGQSVAYDPEDWRARPTVREGTDASLAASGAVRPGTQSGIAYDPDWKLRPTVREGTDFDRTGAASVFGGAKRSTVYDPDASARKTIKEDFSQESETLNLAAVRRSVARDPDDRARATLKETELRDLSSKGSVHVRSHNTTDAIDYDSIRPRTTNKDMIDSESLPQGAPSKTVNAAYDTTEFEARTTHRQLTSHLVADAAPTRTSRGETVSNFDVPLTQKGAIAERSRKPERTSGAEAKKSYGAYYNADVTTGKEIKYDYDFVANGAKSTPTIDFFTEDLNVRRSSDGSRAAQLLQLQNSAGTNMGRMPVTTRGHQLYDEAPSPFDIIFDVPKDVRIENEARILMAPPSNHRQDRK